MKSAAVMPAYNEEAVLLTSCGSLGFGPLAERAPEADFLVIVDNNSDDATAELCGLIRDASLKGAVHCVYEPEQGYVPARASGADALLNLCRSSGISPDEMLLVQADADTVYHEGYVGRLVRAARQCGRGRLLEAATLPTKEFRSNHAVWQQRTAWCDAAAAPHLAPHELQVVVDDKASAMRLADYLLWAGHQRDYDSHGDELLGETTRLFMRGLRHGARRLAVEDALAFPSRRRLDEDAGLQFACAGFPREARWRGEWRQRHGQLSLREFEELSEPAAQPFVAERLRHLLLLFDVLPRAVCDGTANTPPDANPTGSAAYGNGPAEVLEWLFGSRVSPDPDELAAAALS